MIEGALILISGMAIGGAIYHYYLQENKVKPEKPKESPYDKYKNQDGLYSRSAIKAAKER